MVQLTSHEELEELSSSRILECSENCHPGSPPEIARQDNVFLDENPKCLAMEQGKRGRDGGNIETNLPVMRNHDSPTISYFKPAAKLPETIQPSVNQTGARTYVPCKADLRIENEGSDHRSTSVRSTTNPASKSSPLVNR
jgi:hypothetical protein